MVTVINFRSNALGDNIAASPYAELYQKKAGGIVVVKTIWNSLFEDKKNLLFVNKSFEDANHKTIDVNFRFKAQPLQKFACDSLELPYREVRPAIKRSSLFKFESKKKYVCIGTHSTAQMKYWNNCLGWAKVVEYLKEMGYDVYCIDRNKTLGVQHKMNTIPEGVKNEAGGYPIEYRVAQIDGCDFFIGLSSGLSWLAWSLGKKVVMISGCTETYNEFSLDNHRVANNGVCHGCLNDESLDNKNGMAEWMYCPRNKNFECSTEITFEMVKEKIDLCMKRVVKFR